jgi:hypothetical protein
MFDAADDQAIMLALKQVLTDDAFREELSKFGLEHAKQFNE